jgi:serine/threonine-protein kinase
MPRAPLIDEQAVRTQLEKILASQRFAKGERGRQFLRYIVERTLEGRSDDIKEYSIAVEVFGRAPSYDPHVDAAVRVEASRLRDKLRHYYDVDALKNEIRIELPLGTYVPVFSYEKRTGSKWPGLTARRVALAVVAIAGLLWWWVSRQRPDETSVAVLPFTVGAGGGDDYFNEGLTNEIIGRLTAVPALRVIAATSVLPLKDKPIGLRDIGQRLNVDTVVSGNLSFDRGRIRVAVRLSRVKDGQILWAEHYDRELKDLFDVEDQIARAVANGLRLHLSEDETMRLARRTPASMDAYNLYLQGRYFWQYRNRYWNGGPMAADYFEQAIRKDPSYAPAYAGMADFYNFGGDGLSAGLALTKARDYATRAVSLDGNLAEAHTSLAIVNMHSWDWSGAEREFKRALQINPGYSFGHLHYAQMLMFQGRSGAALEHMERARQLDPVPANVGTWVGQVHYFAGRYDLALHQYQKVLNEDPENLPARHCLGTAFARLGRFDDAIREFNKTRELRREDVGNIRALIQVYAQSGKRDTAIQLLGELETIAQRRRVSPWIFAHVYAVLGPPEKALDYLEQAFAQHEMILVFLKVEPIMRSLHAQPRFQRILHGIGLPD